jgi:hypothetical protein
MLKNALIALLCAGFAPLALAQWHTVKELAGLAKKRPGPPPLP